MNRLTAPQILVISFLCAIALGTIALSLPVATQGPGRMPLVDSLFTATSATCVTGLIVRDTGSYFTPFGRWVIFALFQAGGLGIMTFSTLFAVMLGRKIGFTHDEILRSTLDSNNKLGLRKLISYILGITLAVEAIGAAALYLRWKAVTDWGVMETLERAVFHSVSGFCNAGFALFKTSLMRFEGDPVINITMMALIFTGGIGFVVIMDLSGLFLRRKSARQMSLQTKTALVISLILIAVGAFALLFFEKNNLMKSMSFGERMWGSVFQSVTARTAGFNTISIAELTLPSLLVLISLMFIGASPGSTGGGIKTCTFAVLVMVIWNMFKNRRRVMIFGRSVPQRVVREALIIVFLSALWVFVFTVLVAYFYGRSGVTAVPLSKVLFEVVSAFGTVGLSAGITGDLDAASKLCITATMLAGRIGPLTLAMAVAFREREARFVFPEESLMVG